VRTLVSVGVAEQTITKSRFCAQAAPCENERAVALFLRQLASQHAGAHHLAYAFRLKTAEGIVPRFSDAGEPSGTAGLPIVKLLEGRDLVNVCVGVIRYYGGVNLGTGGLARAYGGIAKLALEAAKTAPYVEIQTLKLTLDYKQFDALERDITRLQGRILSKDFAAYVSVVVQLPATAAAELQQRYAQ
jgi:uncharacterized YigZ family protein